MDFLSLALPVIVLQRIYTFQWSEKACLNFSLKVEDCRYLYRHPSSTDER